MIRHFPGHPHLFILQGLPELSLSFENLVALMNRFSLLLFGLIGWLGLSLQAFAVGTVVIDAGHGGHDRGGVPGQRLIEKTYTLDVSKRLQARLRSAGFRTVMTRSTDDFISLPMRCSIANSQRDAIFISVHFNSAQREGANGIETYYYSGSGARYAAAVHAKVLRAAGTEDRHVRQRGFYVLRNTRIPAVLAELGFLTNRSEGNRITGAAYRQRLADALADAIISRYR
jgi:N-acetylmuramoyl-L-alanine amidase